MAVGLLLCVQSGRYQPLVVLLPDRRISREAIKTDGKKQE